MGAGMNPGGKRERLARGLHRCGAPFLLSLLPARNSLVVLNYHRIGDPGGDLFDPGVFSATADQFDEQISYLKTRVSLITLEEAMSWIAGADTEKARRSCVLITFDDGYLDNYEIAYPILKSHGAQGVFFLATGMVGSCHIPWWDQIAYSVKTAQKRRFSLSYPAVLAVDLDQFGVEASLQAILKLYKRAENTDTARFMQELAAETEGAVPPTTLRRFLNWEEAREMAAGGMAIGSHTHSHHLLSQLPPEQQCEELSRSRAILREELGANVSALAYPVGGRTSFTNQTKQMAREAGYRAAFSFYGGTNLPGKIDPFDVRRIGIGGQSKSRFQVQMSICRVTGSYWP
ncbi:MAG: polysaccharide deacetylase family protein [Terracidiphilus sp.]